VIKRQGQDVDMMTAMMDEIERGEEEKEESENKQERNFRP
jgi:hypothetical protein